ncbi:MAG: hypothetical protein RMY64_28815 [Nostoc sp. DedQUE08]|uniref:hypothetical protein n=1 Tax=Nostoc sp. DedQUE08 TaxID=3075393 RepID=UPI002AD3EBEC|nr:hypothetical protein [Nostoc sp. DedQUE08]MDZ8069567.1 hypothetical protein [Nostoc sp. DedQUE08]
MVVYFASQSLNSPLFGLKQKFISVTETLGSDRIPHTHSIDYVKQACAFINQQIGELEPKPIRNQGILNNPDEIY